MAHFIVETNHMPYKAKGDKKPRLRVEKPGNGALLPQERLEIRKPRNSKEAWEE